MDELEKLRELLLKKRKSPDDLLLEEIMKDDVMRENDRSDDLLLEELMKDDVMRGIDNEDVGSGLPDDYLAGYGQESGSGLPDDFLKEYSNDEALGDYLSNYSNAPLTPEEEYLMASGAGEDPSRGLYADPFDPTAGRNDEGFEDTIIQNQPLSLDELMATIGSGNVEQPPVELSVFDQLKDKATKLFTKENLRTFGYKVLSKPGTPFGFDNVASALGETIEKGVLKEDELTIQAAKDKQAEVVALRNEEIELRKILATNANDVSAAEALAKNQRRLARLNSELGLTKQDDQQEFLTETQRRDIDFRKEEGDKNRKVQVDQYLSSEKGKLAKAEIDRQIAEQTAKDKAGEVKWGVTKDYQKLFKDSLAVKVFVETVPKYNQILGVLNSPRSGTADFTAIIQFFKLLDPASIVSPKEAENFTKAASLYETIERKLVNVVNLDLSKDNNNIEFGTVFTDDVINDIRRLVHIQMAGNIRAADAVANSITDNGTFKSRNIPNEDVTQGTPITDEIRESSGYNAIGHGTETSPFIFEDEAAVNAAIKSGWYIHGRDFAKIRKKGE